MADGGAPVLASDSGARHEALAALREDEQRYQEFPGAGSEWLWEMDQQLRFSYVSPVIEDSIEIPRDSYLGRTRFDIGIQSLNRDAWAEHRKILRKRLPFKNFRFCRYDAAGNIRHVVTSGRPLLGADGRFVGYRGVGRDITAQVEALRRAEAAELRLSEALDAIPDGFVIYDADERLVSCNVRHRLANVEVADLIVEGAKFEDVLRAGLERRQHPAGKKRREAWIKRRLERFRNPQGAFEVQLPDGRWARVVERKTRDGGTVGIRTNVTEQKKREEALKKSEHQLRAITDNLPVIISYIDADQRIRFCNAQLSAWYKKPASKILGRRVKALQKSAQYAVLQPRIKEALQGKTVRFDVAVEYPDGIKRAVALAYVPDIGPKGRVRGFFGLGIDVSDREQAKQRLVENEERLRDFAELGSDWFWETDEQLRYTSFIGEKYADMVSLQALFGSPEAEQPDNVSVEFEDWAQGRAAVQARQPFRDVLVTISDGNAKPRYRRISGKPVFDADGSFKGYRGIGIDATAEVTAQRAAAEIQQSLEDALESMPETFALWGADDRLILCNERFRQHSARVAEKTATGIAFEGLIRARLEAGLISVPGDKEAWLKWRLRLHRQSNATFEVALENDEWALMQETRTSSGNSITIGTDITELKRSERELEARARHQQAIAELSQYALWEDDFQKLVQHTVKLVAEVLKVRFCDVLRLLPGGKAFLLEAGVGWSQGLLGTAAVPNDCSVQAGYTFQFLTPVVVEDLSTETRFGATALLQQHGVVSSVSVTIAGRQTNFGVLGVYANERRQFSQHDSNFLQSVATVLAAAIRRYEVEAQLRDTSQELRLITDNLPVLIAYIDEDCRYRFANETAREWHGFNGRDIVGKSVASVVGEENYRKLLPHFESARAGNVVQFDADLSYGDGEHRYVAATYVPDKRSRGASVGFYALVVDITERKLAEAALLQSEKRLRATTDSALDSIIVIDEAGIIVEFNPAAEACFGYRREDAIGKRLADLILPERYRQAHFAGLQRYLKTGESAVLGTRIEIESMHADGSEFPVELAIEVAEGVDGKKFFVGYIRDITERRQAESALKESEKQLADAQRIGRIGHWTWSIESGKFAASPEWRRIYGFEADRPLTFEMAASAIHDEDRPAARRKRLAAMAEKQAYRPAYRIIRTDGVERFIEGTTNPLFDANGKVSGYFGVAQDVTERRVAELALKKRAEQQRAVVSFGERAMACVDLSELLRDAARVMAEPLDVKLTAVLELLAGGETFLLKAGVGWPAGSAGAATLPNVHRTHADDGGQVQSVVIIDDIEGDATLRHCQALRKYGAVSYAGVTIRGEGKVYGALAILNTTPRRFGLGERQFLEELANLLGSAIRRVRSEEELRRSEDQQRRLSSRLGALSHRLMSVREAERRQLASILHDDLGQNITALKINLSSLTPLVDNSDTLSLISNGLELTDQMLEQIRDLASSLRPPMLDELGLVATLEWLGARLRKQAGLEVSLDLCSLETRLRRDIETACFRITQEALTNVMRHSGTLKAHVALEVAGDELRLTISDAGVGFDVERQQQMEVLGERQGINGMREQSSLVGGALAIESAVREGTRILVRVPLPR